MKRDHITGAVLAGGRARRMEGQDKGLITLLGRPMVAYVIDALRPQVDGLIINANRNLEGYGAYGYPVVQDGVGEYFGPLAGMLSALRRAPRGYVLTAPCDSPLVAPDLAVRLWAALQRTRAEIAVAHDGRRMQPVFALLPTRLADSVHHFLLTGERKIDTWYAQHHVALADLSDRPETFLNVNTEEERRDLEERLRAGSGSQPVAER